MGSSSSRTASRGSGDRALGKATHGSGERVLGCANPNAGKKAAAQMTFAVGDVVDHKTFGRGRVTKVDGDLLHIKFAKNGTTKKLLKDYAPIVRIDS